MAIIKGTDQFEFNRMRQRLQNSTYTVLHHLPPQPSPSRLTHLNLLLVEADNKGQDYPQSQSRPPLARLDIPVIHVILIAPAAR
ncbi:hypothetical protein BT96DRAFT_304977 [Gymnopus androsaceus JB14]|uniref:Uncharacterized protein n=1 Tax=Gymnopus androsaceus JB14 TaxID=1447944 RepID=A0A6A4IAH6_9AGAR|nr:hypothetical protein BT96DRAFT_304977 [Gymnopus androsaceus JB14]